MNKYTEDPGGGLDSLKVDGTLGANTKDRLNYFLAMNGMVDNPDSAYANVLSQIRTDSEERRIMDSLKEIDKDILK